MGEIEFWPSRSISNTVQQLGDAKEEDSVVQILNDVLEQCKKRITTVEYKGEGAMRLSGDLVDESDRLA